MKRQTKNKAKKIVTMLCALMMCGSVLTGCGNQQTPEQLAQIEAEMKAQERFSKELKQNDYRGGVQRCGVLKTSILNTMETMKANNITVRESNPNGFWNVEGYQDFVSTFLNASIISDTQWFNEEEISPDDPEKNWESTLSQMKNNKLSFTVKGGEDSPYVFASGVEVLRREKDDYSVSNVPFKAYLNDVGDKTYEGKMGIRVLYDCDKDWCKAYGRVVDETIGVTITPEIFEFMRIDNDTFAIQTNRERLFVVLKPVEKDVDIREREIKEFYYSRLVADGMRTTFKPYIPLPEYDEVTMAELKANKDKNKTMAEYLWTNEEGDLANYYGEKNSVFFYQPSEITADNFVFEDKALQQAICYKDGVLVATTYNKLSTEYEQFTYAMADADKKVIEELENKVQIKNLVGFVDASSAFKEEMERQKEQLEDKLNGDKKKPEETTAVSDNAETSDGSSETEETEETSETEKAEETEKKAE